MNAAKRGFLQEEAEAAEGDENEIMSKSSVRRRLGGDTGRKAESLLQNPHANGDLGLGLG